MSATTQAGKIVWRSDLFDDPRLELSFPPPLQIPGQAPVSNDTWRRQIHSYVGHLFINRIAFVADCEANYIDHHLPNQLRHHYVHLASGTHLEYLLDAKSGDLVLYAIN